MKRGISGKCGILACYIMAKRGVCTRLRGTTIKFFYIRESKSEPSGESTTDKYPRMCIISYQTSAEILEYQTGSI